MPHSPARACSDAYKTEVGEGAEAAAAPLAGEREFAQRLHRFGWGRVALADAAAAAAAGGAARITGFFDEPQARLGLCEWGGYCFGTNTGRSGAVTQLYVPFETTRTQLFPQAAKEALRPSVEVRYDTGDPSVLYPPVGSVCPALHAALTAAWPLLEGTARGALDAAGRGQAGLRNCYKHVDACFATFILIDDDGGPRWVDGEPAGGPAAALLCGEALSLLTAGALPAAPHRVVHHPSQQGRRVSAHLHGAVTGAAPPPAVVVAGASAHCRRAGGPRPLHAVPSVVAERAAGSAR
eukprot:gene40307-63491_t